MADAIRYTMKGTMNRLAFFCLFIVLNSALYSKEAQETSKADRKAMISSIEDGKQIVVGYKYNQTINMMFFFKRNKDSIYCMAVDTSDPKKSGELVSVFDLSEEDIKGLDELFAWYNSTGTGDSNERDQETIEVRTAEYTLRLLHLGDGKDRPYKALSLKALHDRVTHKRREVELSKF